jgi:hypothetical protein
MQKNTKAIIFIPIFIAILMVLGVFTLVSAANQPMRTINDPSINSIAENQNVYLPYNANNYCGAWESPFSLEIAALHQITTTNVMEQKVREEQYYAWYNQAFPTLLTALKDSGAGWTRIVINWSEIEPNEPLIPDSPVFTNTQWYDDRLSMISQAGVKIIGVINGAPAWANGPEANLCPAITTDHVQEYQQFLNFVVRRYSQPPYNIHTWEIFNEADNTTEGRAVSHTCLGFYSDIYAQVLSTSYQTIKVIDANATVLMSGIAYENWTEYPNGVFDRYFPDDVITQTVENNFDALNIHYFPDYHLEWERWNPPANPPTCSRPPEDPGTPYDGSGIDVIAKKNFFTNRMSTCFGVNKPIWLTELSEHGVITDTGSLRNQAYYVLKGYSRGLAAGIKNITWFALGVPNDTYHQALLFPDLSPKPAYYAFKTLVSQLNTLTYDHTISFSGGEAYVFKNSCNYEKIVAWGNNVPITVSPATRLEVTDFYGQVTTIQDGGLGDIDGSVNGSIQVFLSLDPMIDSIIIHDPVPVPVFIHVTSP